jgi:hypothetical protein
MREALERVGKTGRPYMKYIHVAAWHEKDTE